MLQPGCVLSLPTTARSRMRSLPGQGKTRVVDRSWGSMLRARLIELAPDHHKVLPWARGQKRDLLSKALEDGARLTFVWDPYNWETNGPEIPLDSRIYSPTL